MHIFAEHFPFLCYSFSLCLARDFSLSILLIIYIDCLVVFCFNLTDNYHTIKAILLWKTDLIIICYRSSQLCQNNVCWTWHSDRSFLAFYCFVPRGDFSGTTMTCYEALVTRYYTVCLCLPFPYHILKDL